MSRIYIFDDEPGQEAVRAALAGTGAEVEGSDDFDVALEAMHQCSADLLVVGQSTRILGLSLLDRLGGGRAHLPTMLVAETLKQAEMATACRMGVGALLVGPFSPVELRKRVGKLLGHSLELRKAELPASAPLPAADRPCRDVLIGDCDGEGGFDLAPLLPAGLQVDRADTPADVIERCRGAEYRLVIVDSTHANLVPPVRALEPGARLAMVYLKTRADRTDDARKAGCDAFLCRPYDRAELDEVLFRELGWRDVLGRDGNVLRPAGFPHASRFIEEYYQLLLDRAPGAIDALAEACFDDVVLDLSFLPAHIKHTAELIVEVANQVQRRGMSLRVVAPRALASMVRGLPGEHDFEAFESLSEAVA